MSRRRAWWLAIRPRTLPAAVGPVLVGLGVALGEGVFVLGRHGLDDVLHIRDHTPAGLRCRTAVQMKNGLDFSGVDLS